MPPCCACAGATTATTRIAATAGRASPGPPIGSAGATRISRSPRTCTSCGADGATLRLRGRAWIRGLGAATPAQQRTTITALRAGRWRTVRLRLAALRLPTAPTRSRDAGDAPWSGFEARLDTDRPPLPRTLDRRDLGPLREHPQRRGAPPPGTLRARLPGAPRLRPRRGGGRRGRARDRHARRCGARPRAHAMGPARRAPAPSGQRPLRAVGTGVPALGRGLELTLERSSDGLRLPVPVTLEGRGAPPPVRGGRLAGSDARGPAVARVARGRRAGRPRTLGAVAGRRRPPARARAAGRTATAGHGSPRAHALTWSRTRAGDATLEVRAPARRVTPAALPAPVPAATSRARDR